MTSASVTYIRFVVFGVAALLSTSVASGATLFQFQRLTEDRFVVSHMTGVGGTKKASKFAHQKAASICVAAGFTFMDVLGQRAGAGKMEGVGVGGISVGIRTNATSTLLVRFKHENENEGEEVLDCKENSVPRYVAKARKGLERRDAEEDASQSPTRTTAAKLRFQRLTEDSFVVKQMGMGRPPTLIKRLFSKASSLCVATGFSWLEMLDYDAAGARLEVHFKHKNEGEVEDLLDCKEMSEPRYVEVAKEKLDELGVKPSVASQSREENVAASVASRADEGSPLPSIRDALHSGGSGPELVVILAGSFQAGCVSGVVCDPAELPVHTVTIPAPLAVGKYEVTFSEWDACVESGGCRHVPDDEGWDRGNRPVVNVSWGDTQEYVAWLSAETGFEYRLLSESEWEYAARAGTSTAYSWGNEIGDDRANCRGCGSRWDDVKTAPVGSFGANGFGLHDMHGNVEEWVEDCWNDIYVDAPSDGSAWRRGDCSVRVLRGGSWFNDPRNLRSANRFWLSPGDRDSNLGFRVARTLTP